MESQKYSHEEMQWAKEVVKTLAAEFPDANIREDDEYFIYDMKTRDGDTVQGRTPKWQKIPMKGAEPVEVEKIMRAELQFRHLYGTDDYNLSDALRQAEAI